MGHYAFIDENNIVTEVITGIDEDNTDTLPEGFDSWEDWYLTQRPEATSCKRTSYNTVEGVHILGGTPFRGTYAGIGFSYDSENDVFIPPQPYPSWSLDDNFVWQAPLDKPSDFDTVFYFWNENAYQSDNTTGWEQG
tara:strand:- start:3171 stop:3581 length:411 start_codon:yes stop_codon:yes gene_type:complete